MNENPTDDELADACMWHRHDFGLVDEPERKARMAQMHGYWRAIWKAVHTPGRGGEFKPWPPQTVPPTAHG